VVPLSSPVYPDSGDKHGARFGEAELVEAIREDERRQGRPHTPRERAAFVRGFVQESARLAAWKVR